MARVLPSVNLVVSDLIEWITLEGETPTPLPVIWKYVSSSAAWRICLDNAHLSYPASLSNHVSTSPSSHVMNDSSDQSSSLPTQHVDYTPEDDWDVGGLSLDPVQSVGFANDIHQLYNGYIPLDFKQAIFQRLIASPALTSSLSSVTKTLTPSSSSLSPSPSRSSSSSSSSDFNFENVNLDDPAITFVATSSYLALCCGFNEPDAEDGEGSTSTSGTREDKGKWVIPANGRAVKAKGNELGKLREAVLEQVAKARWLGISQKELVRFQ